MIATLALKRNPKFLISHRFVKVLIHLQWLLCTKKEAELGQEEQWHEKCAGKPKHFPGTSLSGLTHSLSSFHYVVVCVTFVVTVLALILLTSLSTKVNVKNLC